MNQDLVLQSLSLSYWTFGPRYNCQRRMQLLKSEAAWSAWPGALGLLACPELWNHWWALPLSELWEEVRELWRLWKDEEAIKWQFLRPTHSTARARVIWGVSGMAEGQWGSGEVFGDGDGVQLGSVTEGRLWIWLWSLRFLPFLRNQHSWVFLWKAWTLTNAVWGTSTS